MLAISNNYESFVDKSKFHNTEFLFAICHELKNPLNAVTAFASLLKTAQNSQEINEYADEIGAAAADLNEIVGDLLDVAAANSGNFSVDLKKEIDARDVIRRSIRLNSDYALRRKITITNLIANDITPIKLDAKRLKQVLTNLISNAIKYSPKDSEIKIEANEVTTSGGFVHGSSSAKKFLEINVIDHGFGMSEQQLGCAFEKYTTFANPNSDVVDSFGFGLPITKQLVELQQGTIEITSRVNKGTRVNLKFPY